MSLISFDTKSATVTIDYDKCLAVKENTSNPSCGFMCVKSCRLYGRNVLRIEGKKPVLTLQNPEEIIRLDNECLACEYSCMVHGSNCITIHLPLTMK